jgi:tetratricopeptide (TPR) repeat protein
MKGIFKIGVVLASLAVLLLFAWLTKLALHPVAHGIATTHFARGYEMQKAGNLTGALTEYDRAIALDPSYYQAYDNRGLVKATLGQIDAAIADYDRAIALHPTEEKAFFGRGRARVFQRDPAAALADFDRALQLNPKDGMAYGARSETKVTLGDLDGAKADAERAVTLQPSATTWNARSWVKRADGDLAGALADLNQAIDIAPKFARSYVSRGHVEFMLGQWGDALADLRHFCELTHPPAQDYPRFYIWLTRAHLGETEAATSELASFWNQRKVTKPDAWTSTIAEFLLGQISEDQLLVAAKSPDAKKQRCQMCEAWYYSAEKKLLAGDRESAAHDFQQCVETEERDYIEYGLAKAELKQLGR